MTSKPRLLPAVLAAGLALAAAAPAQAAFPGANGKLAHPPVFPMADTSIGTIAPDGRQAAISTGTVAGPANIAWSRDGRRLAFDGPATSGGTGRALYVVNADGSGLRQVGRGDAQRFNPVFTPDGTRLVFVQDNGAQGGSGDVYSVSTSGSGLTRLTTSRAWDGAPDVAVDGSVVWSCRTGGRPQLCTMALDGSGKTVLASTGTLSEVAHPSWSPDGRAIAFSARRTATGPESLFRVARTGAGLTALPGGDASRPAWSPDGSRIASERYVDEGVFSIAPARATDGAVLGSLAATEAPWNLDPSGWQPVA